MGRPSLVVIVALLSAASGAKFLLIPGPVTSHCLEMMSIGHELLQRGHQVTLYALMFDPITCLSRYSLLQYKSEFKVITPTLDPAFQKTHDDVLAKAHKIIFERANLITFLIGFVPTLINNHCHALFYDKDVLHELEQSNFDMAVIDAVPFTPCLFSMAVHLDIPVVGVGSVIAPFDSQMPLQSNILPHIYMEYSNELTFPERFSNTIMWFLNPVMRSLMAPPVNLSQYSDRLKDVDTRYLIQDAVLFLENSDYVVDYPKAIYPNFVQVGGLTAGPPKPLTGELKELMDRSVDGVIIASFGSILKDIPKELIEKLYAVFQKVNVQVIFKHDVEKDNGKVKTMKWLPQNDLLGHKNTILFLSHCGKNGFWESVFNKVPIVCIPLNPDTQTTAIKVKKYKIGSAFNIFEDTIDEIVSTVKGVMQNPNIVRNMNKIASILKGRPQSPRQRAAAAIEHVIEYGGDHMRPPNISYITYIYADVWLTIIAVWLLSVLLTVLVIQRCCCPRRKIKKYKRE